MSAVLVKQLVRDTKESDIQQVVMVLIHLAATQPQLKALTKSALKVRPLQPELVLIWTSIFRGA